jgi:hypothetical protein
MHVAAKTGGWVLLFYGALFVVSWMVAPLCATKHDNVYFLRDYSRSIYATDVNYAAYASLGLDAYPRQIFILGASPPGTGFLPDRLMSELNGYKVNNLCLGASNITEVSQILRLIEQHVRLARLDQPVFVIGGHFASFLDNQRKFPGGAITDLQKEFIRFRVYRVNGEFVRPIWGGQGVSAGLNVFLRPFILLYKIKVLVTDEAGYFVRNRVLQKLDVGAQFYRDSRERQFHYRGFSDDQFEALNKLMDAVEGVGGKVVFVHMAIPSYFRNDFDIYREYRRKTEYLSRRNDIQVLDLSGLVPDGSFKDDAHPVPAAALLWTDALAHFMKQKVLPELRR